MRTLPIILYNNLQPAKTTTMKANAINSEYQKLITKVAKTFDPEDAINVTIVNDTDLGEAHFVVAAIEYVGEGVLRIPFVIYDDESVFMPRDWQSGELPESSDGIEGTEWVTYPNGHDAIIMNGLPRLFVGDF